MYAHDHTHTHTRIRNDSHAFTNKKSGKICFQAIRFMLFWTNMWNLHQPISTTHFRCTKKTSATFSRLIFSVSPCAHSLCSFAGWNRLFRILILDSTNHSLLSAFSMALHSITPNPSHPIRSQPIRNENKFSPHVRQSALFVWLCFILNVVVHSFGSLI